METIIDVVAAFIGVITAGATVVLAIITWHYVRLTKDYVYLTRQALEENRQMRLDLQTPKIAIYAREIYESLGRIDEAQSIYLCVENVSMGPAYDVKFELVDPSFELPSHISEVRLLKDTPIIKSGIGYLPPGHDRSYRLSNAHEYSAHHELTQQHVQIKVTCKDSRSKTCTDCIWLDFRTYARQ